MTKVHIAFIRAKVDPLQVSTSASSRHSAISCNSSTGIATVSTHACSSPVSSTVAQVPGSTSPVGEITARAVELPVFMAIDCPPSFHQPSESSPPLSPSSSPSPSPSPSPSLPSSSSASPSSISLRKQSCPSSLSSCSSFSSLSLSSERKETVATCAQVASVQTAAEAVAGATITATAATAAVAVVGANTESRATDTKSCTIGTMIKRSSLCNKECDPEKNTEHSANDENKSLDTGRIGSDENIWNTLRELIMAILLAGLGNIAASYWLAKVTIWPVFTTIPQLVILVPALLGLKGNVEMTLASRLSTHANLGDLDKIASRNKIILGNMALIQCQASTVGFIAPIIALGLSYVSEHAKSLAIKEIILLTASSVITANVANLILGSLMCLVILATRKFNVNPDNIATPIAASLGDVITMILLANISHFLYVNLENASWVQNTLLAFLMALIPIWANIARSNSFTSDVIVSGWYPVCGAMLIQNAGGLVMEKAIGVFTRVANLQLVINGVGGNLVAIQASRMSTHLHKYSSHKELPESDNKVCTYPGYTFISSRSAHSQTARLLLLMALPAHVLFLYITELINENYHFTPAFMTVYLSVCFFQVTFLLQLAYNFVHWLWRVGVNPDNSAIPFLTALADLIGAVLLASAFVILYLIGDVNASIDASSDSIDAS